MAEKRRRLGRGLEALLGPISTADASASGDLRHVRVDAIVPNPYQPRQAFNQEAIEELASSMKSSGLLQPIVLRPGEDGTYQLIAGERRWRAAQSLGWERIGAVVRDVDDRTLLTLALVENLQRDALSPIDEANGYRRLIEEFQTTHGEVAELVGRDRSTIANSLRLLKLPDSVRDMLRQGALTTGHARALLQLEEPRKIEKLAELVVKNGWSVREAEAKARGDRAPQRRPRHGKSERRSSPEIRRIEDELRRHLQTDVYIRAKSRGAGRLEVSFYSDDDLTRLLERILGRPYQA